MHKAVRVSIKQCWLTCFECCWLTFNQRALYCCLFIWFIVDVDVMLPLLSRSRHTEKVGGMG